MSNVSKIWLVVGGALALLLLLPMAGAAAASAMDVSTILNSAGSVIADYEGFVSTPRWDNKQYSWGYGTMAPGANGTITEAQAWADLKAVVSSNYDTLTGQLSRDLNGNQWIALLDFAYNEGIGAAGNLAQYINAGDDTILQQHWQSYIYAGGVVNSNLVERRGYEWQYWTTPV